MIPNNRLSSSPVKSQFLPPDSYPRLSRLVDFEDGGVGIEDPSAGISGWDWKLWFDGSAVRIAREPYTASQVLFTGSGITWVSLAFDANMRPTVAFVQNGVCKLRWYDSAISATTVSSFPNCHSPMLCLDDKRPEAANTRDILFFYVRDGHIRYRQQRDRYTIERTLTAVPSGYIVQAGMARNLRVQIRYHRVSI